jgi:hypothetical protein
VVRKGKGKGDRGKGERGKGKGEREKGNEQGKRERRQEKRERGKKEYEKEKKENKDLKRIKKGAHTLVPALPTRVTGGTCPLMVIPLGIWRETWASTSTFLLVMALISA